MLSNNFWETVTPSVLIQKSTGYLPIPAGISINFVSTGVPSAIVKFNYVCSNNFCLPSIPAQLGIWLSFNLAIRYTDSKTGNVIRYKLWNLASDPMDDIPAPLYTGQVIQGAACSIEVWSLGDQSYSGLILTSLQIATSIKNTITALTDATTFQVSGATQAVTLYNTNSVATAPDTTNCLFWFDSTVGVTLTTGKVSSWADRLNAITLSQATAGLQPTVAGDGSIQFNGADPDSLAGIFTATPTPVLTFYGIFQIIDLNPGYEQVFSFFGNTFGVLSVKVTFRGFLLQYQFGSGPNTIVSSNVGAEVGEYFILELSINQATNIATLNVFDLTTGLVAATGTTTYALPAGAETFTLGGGTTQGFYVKAFMAYSAVQTYTQRQQTLQYLLHKYGASSFLPLPLVFNADAVS